MLDLFTIFSKGGIVLWCFQSTSQIFTPSVNALITNVILQERSGSKTFAHGSLLLKYKLDNEFELVFVVAYQKILQLEYIDKFLDDVHLEFRDKYKNELCKNGAQFPQMCNFSKNFNAVLKAAEEWGKAQSKLVRPMRAYNESEKSKKTIASMIVNSTSAENKENSKKKAEKCDLNNAVKRKQGTKPFALTNPENSAKQEDVILQNRMKLAEKMGSVAANSKKKISSNKSPKKENGSVGKKPRIWALEGTANDMSQLDYTRDKGSDEGEPPVTVNSTEIVGKMVGGVKDLVVSSSDEETQSDDDEEFKIAAAKQGKTKTSGVFSLFRSLVSSNSTVTREKVDSVLEKLKEHLISKNVAADIAQKLCDSVAAKLDGKVLSTFETVSSSVKNTMTDSLVQILSPKRRVDILRDILDAKSKGRPYVMVFCGVNGVGKSTNLAKICFWLIENNLQVLIAACDTFRAGAVEQLRTHTRHLNALHPPSKHNGLQMVQLYEKGYGKDAAGIAMEAIAFARDSGVHVVLVDTAGRMQDNEPLMRALSKLVNVNSPDLVLFVGEALVGNEAVDQLVKFNQAMADYSMAEYPHLIDGIVLTKFDTIDDKVGAAISMTYITGQPIVFVGTGQTYTDLKSLNAKAIVTALMK